jgi:hypothetical protein
MTDDRLASVERRLALVEAFLDYQWRERQKLAALATPNSHGLSDWRHSCPIVVGPVGAKSASWLAQSPLGNSTDSVGVCEMHAVQNVKLESLLPPESARVVNRDETKIGVQPGREGGETDHSSVLKSHLTDGLVVSPLRGTDDPSPVAGINDRADS